MIDILLATYNSSNFLEQTIESILSQDYEQWRLLIRDGGSQDDTLKIIERYTQQYKDRIILFPSAENTSARENFSILLSKSSSDYVMFCDHDDIWLNNKISKSISLYRVYEKKHGRDVPILLFTDKYIVDKKLSRVSDSYFKYQNLDPRKIELNYLLVQNIPTGCTILINRAFADLCGFIPPQAVMHDHWLALIGSTLGKIVYLDEPTLLYRQHDKNYFGAIEYGWLYFLSSFLKGIKVARKRFYQNVQQAKFFLERFQYQLCDNDVQLLTEFASLQHYGWLKRRKVLVKYKILKTGLRRNIGIFLII